MKKYLVGIDEAGRGPLAGPVAVAAVVWPLMSRFDLDIRGDSKKMSAKKREEWFAWIKEQKKFGRLNFAISLVGEKIIDQQGISEAIKIGIVRCLNRLNLVPKNCLVLLDGGLRAPKLYQNQRTIIRGDEKIKIISLASIVAKVQRDQRMVKLSTKYPGYDLEIHKGYGTTKHRTAIKDFGPSPLHRRSFLRNWINLAK